MERHELQLEHAGLRVTPENATVAWGSASANLAPAELQILVCLMRAGGDIVRRSVLETAAWGVAEAVTPNALDVALHRLRRKLQGIGSSLSVVNIRNLGFALRHAPAAA